MNQSQIAIATVCDEVKDLLNGIAPKRDDFDDSPTASSMPPKTSVPKSGDATAPQPN